MKTKNVIQLSSLASIWGGSFIFIRVLAPFLIFFPIRHTIDLHIIENILVLAFLCSAVAYIIYYRLIADVGPSKALTVTFLMPVFGFIWGVIFLNEIITRQMLLGCFFIIGGTVLVLTKMKSKLFSYS